MATCLNKNAKALKVHSVIYLFKYMEIDIIFFQKYVSNVQNRFVFLFGRSNLTISTVFLALTHYLRFRRPYWIYEENGYLMDILKLTSHYMYILC